MIRPLYAVVILAIGLTGCAGTWDKISSRRFRENPIGAMYDRRDPLDVMRTSLEGDDRAAAMRQVEGTGFARPGRSGAGRGDAIAHRSGDQRLQPGGARRGHRRAGAVPRSAHDAQPDGRLLSRGRHAGRSGQPDPTRVHRPVAVRPRGIRPGDRERRARPGHRIAGAVRQPGGRVGPGASRDGRGEVRRLGSRYSARGGAGIEDDAQPGLGGGAREGAGNGEVARSRDGGLRPTKGWSH